MIPKRAFFVWAGGKPMSWLRGLSIETFKRHNPDWKVNLLHVNVREGLSAVQSADIARYHELALHGGVYFDTDIVFFRPFPEHLLDSELGLTIHPTDRFMNIAVLMSKPRHPFFETVARFAEDSIAEYDEPHRRGHQFFGTRLLNRRFWHELYLQDEAELPSMDRFSARFGDVCELPRELINPVEWDDIDRLYRQGPTEWPRDTIGLHWYGDDERSKRYESLPKSAMYTCYLKATIELALQSEAA